MPSKTTRLAIITRALKLAGRDMSLRTLAEELLNDVLRDEAFSYKYPDLRKTGTPITLLSGASTASLPSDIGAGSDNLLFGPEATPMYEVSMDEFVFKRGFPSSTQNSSRPTYYCIDSDAAVFKFNCVADQNYSFIPVYYYVPDDIALGTSGDSSTVWIKNDLLAVQMLVEYLYQYLGDPREIVQAQRVEALRFKFRRGTVPMGGGSTRVLLARNRFK